MTHVNAPCFYPPRPLGGGGAFGIRAVYGGAIDDSFYSCLRDKSRIWLVNPPLFLPPHPLRGGASLMGKGKAIDERKSHMRGGSAPPFGGKR